ncbi:MAG: hypothetical protein ACRDE5_16015, partial [Ginsengibacter sp.]
VDYRVGQVANLISKSSLKKYADLTEEERYSLDVIFSASKNPHSVNGAALNKAEALVMDLIDEFIEEEDKEGEDE